MPANKIELLTHATYEEFEEAVLTTSIFKDEILSDYILDRQEGILNGMITGGVLVPTVETILKENGQMHFEMLQMYYLG